MDVRFRARYPSQGEERLAVSLQFAETLGLEIADEDLSSVVEIPLFVKVLVRIVWCRSAILGDSGYGDIAVASLITDVDRYLVGDGTPPRSLGHRKQTFAVFLHLVAADRQQEPLGLLTCCSEVGGSLGSQLLVFSEQLIGQHLVRLSQIGA